MGIKKIIEADVIDDKTEQTMDLISQLMLLGTGRDIEADHIEADNILIELIKLYVPSADIVEKYYDMIHKQYT